MKTMTCRQLGGACETEFNAGTFEEIAEMSRKHGMEMYQRGDKEHLEAMGKMRELMKNPEDMNRWFQDKKQQFEALPEK